METRTNIKNKHDGKGTKTLTTKNKKKQAEAKGTAVHAAVQNSGSGPETSRPESVERQITRDNTAHLNDQFGLEDESAWSNIPEAELPGRFLQYRQLARVKIQELEHTIQDTVHRTVRKVDTLKSQFHDHKSKWESERTVLIDQVDQSLRMQTEAEHEADTVLSHLENFIVDQEHVEQEEEHRLATTGGATSHSLENTNAHLAKLQEEHAEEELQQRLLHQTDDAKAELSRANSNGTTSPVGEEQQRTLNPSGGHGHHEVIRLTIDTPPHQDAAVDGVPEDGSSANYKVAIADSIERMLGAESTFTDAQQHALKSIRDAVIGSKGPGGVTDDVVADSVRTLTIYTLASHLGQESVHLGIDPASLYQCLARLCTASLADNLKGDAGMMFTIPHAVAAASDKLRKMSLSAGHGDPKYVRGDTTDAAVSAPHSRASLREHHKTVAASLRASAEGRRSRSPVLVSFKSHRSVLSDAELDEDGDMPFPPDTGKELHDVGTSPMPLTSKQSDGSTWVDITDWKGIHIYEHPIVQEYLKAYRQVLNFKEALTNFFIGKDVMSAGQVLNDLDPVLFDETDKVQPQIEKMTDNIYNILNESASLISNVVHAEREYPVSSLNMSCRDPTRTVSTTRERTPDSAPPSTAKSMHATTTAADSSASEVHGLHAEVAKLHQTLTEGKKHHEDEIHHNTVVMMEMQNTIEALRRELSALVKTDDIPVQPAMQAFSDSPIMFTRLDSERNAKVMKRAVNEKRLNAANYKSALGTMREYVSLPAKRFVHLVHKYVHHKQMKEIEENVRKSNSLNANVFMILDKMETLQSVRAHKWVDRMDQMGAERLHLARLLMDTLEGIERQSGIFLIKPVFSYKRKSLASGAPEETSAGRLHSYVRDPINAGSVIGEPMSNSVAPVPTPTSNERPVGAESSVGNYAISRPISAYQQDGLLAGRAKHLTGDYQQQPVWNPGLSSATGCGMVEEGKFMTNPYLNTPRLLELDINRMLIGQNQISSRVAPGLSTDDRLTNAAHTSVRSYVTVSRPTGQHMIFRHDRPRSQPGSKENSVSPCTPPQSQLRGRSGGHQGAPVNVTIPQTIPSTPPLPPITPRHAQERPLPPSSPPGSSICPTPVTAYRETPSKPATPNT